LEGESPWLLTSKRELAFWSDTGYLILYHNGKSVKADDPIVPNGRYLVPSQINIDLNIPENGRVQPNPNALVGTGILNSTIPQVNL
jgi:hypothetical protein